MGTQAPEPSSCCLPRRALDGSCGSQVPRHEMQASSLMLSPLRPVCGGLVSFPTPGRQGVLCRCTGSCPCRRPARDTEDRGSQHACWIPPWWVTAEWWRQRLPLCAPPSSQGLQRDVLATTNDCEPQAVGYRDASSVSPRPGPQQAASPPAGLGTGPPGLIWFWQWLSPS